MDSVVLCNTRGMEADMKVHTLIISDVHLLSGICQAVLLLAVLKSLEFKRLIIVGDLIEDDVAITPGTAMDPDHLRVIEYLLGLRTGDPSVEIIRVAGNHDSRGNDIVNKILGIKTRKRYLWQAPDGRVFCFVHGDKWDRFISRHKVFSKFFAGIFLCLQRIKILARWLDRWHGRYFRLTKEVAKGAIKFAQRKKIHVIVCGHTHELININSQGVEYWNCGDFTGHKCSYLTMQESGVIAPHVLYEYDAETVVGQ